ncbi:PQQ-dependent sugar dehydrogenase [Mucilaginibacter myungsuensis]|uniref:PQQ-dependent sugar dehydrogenase n=1 Tax=Mucilaginibacter myungsuensis TaxID=649104 RepID=A0A929KY93_9SPHI|nr:PQQ-dependent sugar dehydrogenase [Mucilaginibacter myungsuensis]MBE9663881.1 PQQ-dependent sugar dehydrogenase [Mucilaginibacter myungsuensis]MDN3598403.1 PQQ-dependent sugar dehydrogenase [Mucilaginibacter myungsuensis]
MFDIKASKFILAGLVAAACYSNASAQTAAKPDDNRFTKVVLAQRIEEPMQFQIMKDGKVLYAERKGKLKLYDPATGKISIVHDFPVSTKYVSQTGEESEAEDGFQGVILDPDFDKNHWMYVYYSPIGKDSVNRLERYTWLGKGPLNTATRKKILDVPVQRYECCHVGGGMVFDKDRNLYLSTGDNTFSRASDGFSPLDERPGMYTQDSQKGSSNTNDLRGKILRIHPEPNGTYTIPKGNLFPKGTPKTRAEIYTMGNRNPWRLTIDSKTGWLYWGEVGPDGSVDDFEKRGPQSYDEFNQAKKPGNYGWPYFIGNNFPYHHYNFVTKDPGPLFDSAKPVNTSPNSSGLEELPPTTAPFIWYSKQASKEFPLMGGGGNSAVGGPIFHASDFKNAPRVFPSYFEGKWFITDWVRGWINLVTMDDQGTYQSMERFLPNLQLHGPIDMKFGPNGDLYVLEYGNGYFKDNPEAELIRIEYNGGNRKPQVQASADKIAGALPLTVALSSKGTSDADEGDKLRYVWKITKNGAPFKTIAQADPSVSFTTAGIYKALLTVTDAKGAKNSKSVEIKAGNQPPVVKINITAGNSQFFFPGAVVGYSVDVADKEDGSLAGGKIPATKVSVSANYLSEGYNMTAIASKQGSVDAGAQLSGAQALIAKSDCKACHAVNEKILGPSFTQVGEKYKGDAKAPEALLKKILGGGQGVWGDAQMPAHPTMAESDVKSIVKYILSLGYPARHAKSLPVSGSYNTTVPEGENTDGSFIIRAAYTDKGAKLSSVQSGEQTLVLDAPQLLVSKLSDKKNVDQDWDITYATIKDGGWLKFANVDLTGVKQMELVTARGNGQPADVTLQVRAGSPTGKVLGKYTGKYPGQPIKLDVADAAGVNDLYFVLNGRAVRVNKIKLAN